MPYWAIYLTDPEVYGRRAGSPSPHTGSLRAVVDQPPSLAHLEQWGLGAAYFGEDAPDETILSWCPRRLSFVDGRGPDDGSLQITALAERVRAAEAELARLSTPRPGWLSRLRRRLRKAE